MDSLDLYHTRQQYALGFPFHLPYILVSNALCRQLQTTDRR